MRALLWVAVIAAPVCAGAQEKPARDGGADKKSGAALRFQFGAVTDVQYCDCKSAGARQYRLAPQKLAACVRAFNQEDLAFVVHLGDFIDRDAKSFTKIAPIYQGLKADAYHVLGNHDFSVKPEEKSKVRARMKVGKGYYDFAVKDWRLIAIDGNDLSLYANAPGSKTYATSKAMYDALRKKGAQNAQTWNGGVGRAQMKWLAAKLQDAQAAGENVILFAHFPVYPANPHNLWNDADILALIDRYACVKAYLNGHNHAGHYGERNGVHYLTLKGMVNTDRTAYAIVRVYADRLQLVGHGREPSRTLALRSSKK